MSCFTLGFVVKFARAVVMRSGSREGSAVDNCVAATNSDPQAKTKPQFGTYFGRTWDAVKVVLTMLKQVEQKHNFASNAEVRQQQLRCACA